MLGSILQDYLFHFGVPLHFVSTKLLLSFLPLFTLDCNLKNLRVWFFPRERDSTTRTETPRCCVGSQSVAVIIDLFLKGVLESWPCVKILVQPADPSQHTNKEFEKYSFYLGWKLWSNLIQSTVLWFERYKWPPLTHTFLCADRTLMRRRSARTRICTLSLTL